MKRLWTLDGVGDTGGTGDGKGINEKPIKYK